MNSRPRILTFGQYFRPAFRAGGAARSISNIVDHLGDEFEFWVVCRDRDLGDSSPYDLETNCWTHLDSHHVHYTTLNMAVLGRFTKIMRSKDWDAVYVNSYASPVFSFLARLLHRFGWAGNAPLIVAPRGEFARSALSISPLRKRLMLLSGRILGMHKRPLFQASCEHERQDIMRVIGPSLDRIKVAPDMLPIETLEVPEGKRRRKEQGSLMLSFIARISPIKNLEFLLRAVRACRAKVSLDIYGPIGDENYWIKCQRIIAEMPPNISISEHGAIPREDVPTALVRSNAFVMTTLSENFGHSIFEALDAGVPVLISDQTLWRDLETDKAGFDLALDDPTAFTEVIERWAAMGEAEFDEWRAGARRRASHWVQHSDVKGANRQLFLSAIERSGSSS